MSRLPKNTGRKTKGENKMNELKMIEDDRVNEFRTMLNANRHKNNMVRTIGPHYVVKTITYRNLEPKACYTVVMGAVKKRR